MHNALIRIAAGAVVVLASTVRPSAQAQFSFDWPAIASRLVAQLAPQPDLTVSVNGQVWVKDGRLSVPPSR